MYFSKLKVVKRLLRITRRGTSCRRSDRVPAWSTSSDFQCPIFKLRLPLLTFVFFVAAAVAAIVVFVSIFRVHLSLLLYLIDQQPKCQTLFFLCIRRDESPSGPNPFDGCPAFLCFTFVFMSILNMYTPYLRLVRIHEILMMCDEEGEAICQVHR